MSVEMKNNFTKLYQQKLLACQAAQPKSKENTVYKNTSVENSQPVRPTSSIDHSVVLSTDKHVAEQQTFSVHPDDYNFEVPETHDYSLPELSVELHLFKGKQ